MNTGDLFLLWAAGFAASFFLTPLCIKLALQTRLVDHPAHRKTHDNPVAYLGGVAIFTSLTAVLCFSFFSNLNYFSPAQDSHLPYKNISVFLAGLLMAFWGLADDIFNLKPLAKLAGQAVIALLFSTLAFRFEVLHLPGFHPYALSAYLGVPLTVFWILSVVNAFNLIDGMDGLAVSVAAVSFFLIAAASAMLGQDVSTALALVMLGVIFGFLFYNWKPARIYLGDSGSTGLGMFLAAMLLAIGHKTPFLFREEYPDNIGQPFHYQIIVLTLFVAYPALEIGLSVARRLFRGKPIYRGDQGHIHHRFIKKGWSVQAIVVTAMTVSFLPGLAALAALMNEHGWAAWFFGLSCLVLGLGMPLLGFLDFLQPHAITRSRPHFLIANHFINMQKLKLQLSHSMEEVIVLVNQACHEFGVQGYRIFVVPNAEGKGGCHFSWEQSLEEQREHLGYLHTERQNQELVVFKDHATLEDHQGEAFWIFEPHAKEEELDVEYRVLIHEFMTSILKKIEDLGPAAHVTMPRVIHFPQSHRKNVGSSSLRRHTEKKS